MRLTKNEALLIAQEYKKRFPSLTNEIKDAVYKASFDVVGYSAWIVTGEFKLFGEVREFYYVISDETGKVEYTLSEHGSRNPHLEEDLPKEWAEYTEDDIE